MKTVFTLLISLFVAVTSFAGEWTAIRSGQPAPAQKTLVTSSVDQSIIHFSLDGYFSTTVITPQGPAVVISLDKATPILATGAPDLPKMTASVIIPDLAEMVVDVIDATYQDFENVFVAPSKGNLTRDTDPSTVPYTFGKAYESNTFYPGALSGMRDPYIIRDYRGQTVIAYPFQYNPVARTLRVYTDITVRISSSGETGTNTLVRVEPLEKVDIDFNNIYREHFLNAEGNGSRYTPVPEFGNMLIISYSAFINTIQPYAEWKKQVGYPVEIVDVGTIGNSNAIKTFISSYYNTKGLTFVLLVGDAEQVPTSSTSAGDSDNAYTYIVGGDHYPDVFIGRFSAENVSQVETQVERTLKYEQDPLMASDWFSVCTGIASDQGPGDDNEMDFQHIRNIQNNKLIPFTYTYANELFDGSQGGNDEGGSPTPATVATAVNAGTGIINYTGHGSDGSWGTSGFSIGDVNNLVNHNLLPFIWSVACVNGNFQGSTCFAEAWLRASHNDQPTGAVAFLGSTINQSWDPPMAAQDEMNDILAETYPGYTNRTFGALSMHGCMLMNDEFGSGGDEMTDTWTCFGDPSLMVRTALPATLSVIHDPVLLLGATQMTILCETDGARATLSLDGNIIATGLTSGGSVTLTFNPLATIGTATLTMTAFNFLPHIADIDIIPADGPYVVMESYDITDDAGNGNGLADYNEAVGLTMSLENVGSEDATDVSVTLTTSDPYITITDYHQLYPLIPAGQTVDIENAFAFLVASDVPDQHTITFSLSSTASDETWQSIFILKANAPILNINTLTIDDSDGGNGDGELDPGERAELTINYTNTGHATAYDVDVYFEAQSGFTEVSNARQNFTSIGFLGIFNKTFSVVADGNTPEGIKVDFVNEVTMGEYSLDRVFPLKISARCEDFETGNFSKFDWQSGGNASWQITNAYPQQGYYCAKSGVINHNQNSELSLAYNVMINDSIIFYRKVSSESGDLLKFYINNQLIANWSGTTGGWKREAFAVAPGYRTFRWVYEKNNIGSAGADCAWLDYIILPSPQALTIWAGPDDKVCTGSAFELSGSYGTDFSTIAWTTSGTGTFNDNTNMHPLYQPGDEDIVAGEVLLTLTLTDDQGNSIADDLTLGFGNTPPMPDVPQGPSQVDISEVEVSVYTVEEVEEADNYTWHLEPANAGEVVPHGAEAYVTWNVDYTGMAFISVEAGNECGAGVVSDPLAIEVTNSLVGIPDLNPESFEISVFPNPATERLNVMISGDKPENVRLSLVDFTGRIYRFDRSIDIEKMNLLPGIYLLIAENENQRAIRKVIIH